jgi:helicase
MLRGLSGADASWGELIAEAQTVMALFDNPQLIEPRSLDTLANAAPLIGVSRVLDSASQLEDQIEEEVRIRLALTAGVAFGMWGNFPSATAAFRRALDMAGPISADTIALAATCAPRLLPTLLAASEGTGLARRYLEELNGALHTGATEGFERASATYIELLLDNDDVFLGALMRSGRMALAQLSTLSLARVLRDEEHLGPHVQRLVDRGFQALLPPQLDAIETGLLRESGNSLIAFPTSSGKTLLGLLSLLSALGDSPGLACYVTPYRAVGRQVVTRSRELIRGPRIHALLGGFREYPDLAPATNQELIIATPERLDAQLRATPQVLNLLRCAVFDEAHIVENGARGVRVEGLLARLRLLQDRGANFRIILLSAVIENLERLRQWLRVPPALALRSGWAPTARRTAMWKQGGQLEWYAGHDAIRPRDQPASSVIGSTRLPWPDPHMYPADDVPRMRAQTPRAVHNVAYLCETLLDRLGGPLLCVCATKPSTRLVAAGIAARFEENPTPAPSVAAAVSLIEAQHRYLLPLATHLKHGVAYHNASLPSDVRHLIEDAADQAALKVVVSTTTLAEGVDLPFRATVLFEWMTWQGDAGQAPMPSLLFRNIAGRSGRAGRFTEGDIVIFDNPLGPVRYTGGAYRSDVQRASFLSDSAPVLRSALEVASEDGELTAALGSQILAAIPENPHQEGLADAFAYRTLLGTGDDSGPARHLVGTVIASLLDEGQGALARAASPLVLTDLGAAANRTGFSPESVRRMVRVMSSMGEPASLANAAASLLLALGDVPEQGDRQLRKMARGMKPRFAIGPLDLEWLLEAWLQRESLEAMFALLPYVQRSRRKPPAEAWLEGAPSESWEGEFDKYVDFLGGVFGEFLPWLLRACGALAEVTDASATTLDWWSWAGEVERARLLPDDVEDLEPEGV